MKQPNSPLPWVTFNDSRGISDADSSVMMNTIDRDYDFAIQDNKDIEYIVEACNNYPKAIELLKNLVQYLEWKDDYMIEDSEENENDYGITKQFLKYVDEQNTQTQSSKD